MALPGGGSDRPKQKVLILDQDPEAGRTVRLGLAGSGCQVLSSAQVDNAVRLVEQHKPALLVLEGRLSHEKHREITERTMQLARGQGAAVVLTAREESVLNRVRAIQLGALDLIITSNEPARLSERLKGALARLPGARPEPVTGPGAEQLIAALQQVEEQASTGALTLKRPGTIAQIDFAFGELQQAACGAKRGDDAINEIAHHGDWESQLNQTEPGAKPDPRPPSPSRAFKDVPANLPQTMVEQPEPAAPPPRPRTPVGLSPLDSGIDVGDVLQPEPALDPLAGVEEDDEPTMVEADPLSLAQRMMAASPPPSAPAPAVQGGSDTDEHQAVPPMSADEMDDLIDPSESYDEDAPTLLVDEPTNALTDEVPNKASLERQHSLRAQDTDREAPVSEVDLNRRFPPSRGTPPSALNAASRDQLRQYLSNFARRPLVIAVMVKEVRDALRAAAESLGFKVVIVGSGQEAWNVTHQQRPVALLSDLHLGDADGRELLSAIRSDFVVRETPFLILSADDLARGMASGGAEVITPIITGLETVLGPRVLLHHRLSNHDIEEVPGWVEPVGMANLLRTFGAARVTGNLLLRTGEIRNAVVIFKHGEICGATVNSPQASVGPMALLHLLGFEWKEYFFIPTEGAQSQVPLGELETLVEAASRQNAVLMNGVYLEGIKMEGVELDHKAMDAFLQALPTSCLDVLIRLSEGEPPGELIDVGLGGPAQIKAMLFDMRRKGVILPQTLKTLKLDATAPPVVEQPEEEPAPAPMPVMEPQEGLPRWLVVLIAGAVTVILTAGAYLLYLKVFGG